MDEMQMVREMVADTSLRDLDELAAVRGRLDIAIIEERAGQAGLVRHTRRSRPVRKYAVAAWAAAGIAAVTTAVVILAPDQIGGQVPAANAEAAQVLRSAAAAALTLPDIEPRADQFIYQKDVNGGESWNSADGTRDGLRQGADGGNKIVLPGCRDGQRVAMKGDRVTGTEPCTPSPAYLPDLPTDPDGMLAYLNEHHSGRQGDPNAMGKDIWALMDGHYLRPRSRAALFEAAATVPGLRVIWNAVDPGGRPATEITWSTQSKSGGLFFDVHTFAYLGAWAGQGSSAILQVAIVDQVGQRP